MSQIWDKGLIVTKLHIISTLIVITTLLNGCSSMPKDQVVIYHADCQKDYKNCKPAYKTTYRVSFEGQLVVIKGIDFTYRDCRVFNSHDWICFYKDGNGDGQSFGFNNGHYFENRKDSFGRPLNHESDEYWRGINVSRSTWIASWIKSYGWISTLWEALLGHL